MCDVVVFSFHFGHSISYWKASTPKIHWVYYKIVFENCMLIFAMFYFSHFLLNMKRVLAFLFFVHSFICICASPSQHMVRFINYKTSVFVLILSYVTTILFLVFDGTKIEMVTALPTDGGLMNIAHFCVDHAQLLKQNIKNGESHELYGSFSALRFIYVRNVHENFKTLQRNLQSVNNALNLCVRCLLTSTNRSLPVDFSLKNAVECEIKLNVLSRIVVEQGFNTYQF